MNSAPMDFSSPSSPYRWALGVQASLLAHPHFADDGLPPDVERESEELVRFMADCCTSLEQNSRRTARLEARRAAGLWTDDDRAELRRLLAWHTGLEPAIAARRHEYLAMLDRHGLARTP